MQWFPHALQTCEKCLRSFKRCGWALGSTIMPLSQPLFAQILDYRQNPSQQLECKWSHGAVGEASDPPRPKWNGLQDNGLQDCPDLKIMTVFDTLWVVQI